MSLFSVFLLTLIVVAAILVIFKPGNPGVLQLNDSDDDQPLYISASELQQHMDAFGRRSGKTEQPQ